MFDMSRLYRSTVWVTSVMLLLLGSTALSFASTSENHADLPPNKSSVIVHGRERINLNGLWKFKTDPVAGATVNRRGVIDPFQTVDPNRVTPGENAGFHTQALDDRACETLSVPGNWDLHDDYSEYFNNAWYRRSGLTECSSSR